MTRWDKRLNRFRDLNADITFSEIDAVLQRLGYTPQFPNGGSSHCTYRKNGKMPITVPYHRPINKAYVRMVRELLIQEGLL